MMRISRSWLNSWIQISDSDHQLADRLTALGIEVDEIIKKNLRIEQVFVAKIVECCPHPHSNRLQIAQVSLGGHTPELQIVCGAPNCRLGLYVACAKVGAVLPDFSQDQRLEIATIRGVLSDGMLCSAQELGLQGSEHEGILELEPKFPLGTQITECLHQEEVIFCLSLTPNRADCLSVRGIAREIAASLRHPLIPLPALPTPPSSAHMTDLVLQGVALPLYLTREIRQLCSDRSTPLWMRQRLESSGISSIEPCVDVLNYVMLELGQPLHAFDLDQIKGTVTVRKSIPGEQLVLLNGEALLLVDDKTTVIADDEGLLCIGGIMGGDRAKVSAQTQNILIEAAIFPSADIAHTVQTYNLHTLASHRFQRGVDPEGVQEALDRAVELLGQIGQGNVSESVRYPSIHTPSTAPCIQLRYSRIEALLGITWEASEIQEILTWLGCTVCPYPSVVDGARSEKFPSPVWKVQPPSWRQDLSIEEDLIEVIARAQGYDQIPSDHARGLMRPQSIGPLISGSEIKQRLYGLARLHWIGRGFSETISYSFIPEVLQKNIFSESEPGFRVPSPISEQFALLRTSLIPGLLGTIHYNQSRQQHALRIFEMGTCFYEPSSPVPDSRSTSAFLLKEETRIAGCLSIFQHREHWRGGAQTFSDYFVLKGELEAQLKKWGISGSALRFRPISLKTYPYLHPGQAAEIFYREKALGIIGALHPDTADKLGLRLPVVLFELRIEGVSPEKVTYPLQPPSRYPMTRRDLSFVVNCQILAQDLVDTALSTLRAPNLNVEAKIFDRYEYNQTSGVSQTGVSLALFMQGRFHTLTELEIVERVEQVISVLSKVFGVILRS